MRTPPSRSLRLIFALSIWLYATLACARAFPTQEIQTVPFAPANTMQGTSEKLVIESTEIVAIPTTRVDLPTPTPDEPRVLPTLRTSPETYVIQAGDTLNKIAELYGISVAVLEATNPSINPNWLSVGYTLTIPVAPPQTVGSNFKIIPNSELVYGPAAAEFDVAAFIAKANGYLNRYTEKVDDVMVSGASIIQRVASEYSVNPRLLLAVLEYQSNWVTSASPASDTINYPIRLYDPYRAGLFFQISWAANILNRGFYHWMVNGVNHWNLLDGGLVPVSPTINAGTAGMQDLMSTLYSRSGWDQAVSESGVYATYQALFGSPFQYSIDPVLPADLNPPSMQLPFGTGETWYFTGGPHSAWGDAAAWAALDFAPSESSGCQTSPSWVTAVADGVITRSWNGEVVLDLDGDGFEQTGWSVLYLHIAADGRVAVGTHVQTGDPIGHPSCEGGYSFGTHVHMARRYNGVWISADGNIPFNLDGWISQGSNKTEYDGFLVKGSQSVEAWNGRSSINEIQH